MKIKILILTLLAITLGACNKALDMAPDGKITMDEVFADHEKVAAFLNSCYTNMPAKGTRYFFWSRGPVEWSDEAWDTDAEAESWIMSGRMRSEEHTSELQSLMRLSYAVFCLKKKKNKI